MDFQLIVLLGTVQEVGRRKRCSNDSGQEHPDLRSESSLSNESKTHPNLAENCLEPIADPIQPGDVGNSCLNDGKINQERVQSARRGRKVRSKKCSRRPRKTTPPAITPREDDNEVSKGFHEFLRKNANYSF